MESKNQFEKVIAIEKKTAHKSGFRKGLIVGIFIPILLLSVIMITLIFSRSYVQKKIGEIVVSKIAEDVFTAFPDAYFSLNREKIIKVLDDFTNAASKHQISNAEFQQIGSQYLSALKDKRLTYKELDKILELMRQAAE